jgi:hypothetical protein
MEKRKDAPEAARRIGRNAKVVKTPEKTVCVNRDCKLRKSGCRGNEACPGYKAG